MIYLIVVNLKIGAQNVIFIDIIFTKKKIFPTSCWPETIAGQPQPNGHKPNGHLTSWSPVQIFLFFFFCGVKRIVWFIVCRKTTRLTHTKDKKNYARDGTLPGSVPLVVMRVSTLRKPRGKRGSPEGNTGPTTNLACLGLQMA